VAGWGKELLNNTQAANMRRWKKEIRNQLAGLELDPAREEAIVEELSQDLEEFYAEQIARGAPAAEATRMTFAELSEHSLLARELRKVERQTTQEPIVLGMNRRDKMISDLWQDLRYGARMIIKQPAFSLIAILTLGLGIGANSAIFSLVNTVALRPLPIADPGRVVEITPLQKGQEFGNFSYPFYKDYRDKNEVLDGLAAYRFVPLSLSQGGGNERLWGYLVSGNYFNLLGVSAYRGRMFTQEDDRAQGESPVVVLSHDCWNKRFGGDPNIVGRTIRLNNNSYTVVGVAPPAFKGTVLLFTPEIYAPMNMAKQIEPGSNWLNERGDGMLFGLGRLKRDVTEAQAKTAFDALAVQFGREHPGQENVRFNLAPPGLIVPALRVGVLGFAGVLLLIVGLVLLVACTNLANLLLARAGQRRREIAVRLSLGASRARLIRQLLTESVMLAMAGGAFGWLIAGQIIQLVRAFKPPMDFSLTIDLAVDWRVLLFTLAISLLTGVLFGLIPAWQATKTDLTTALKEDAGMGGGRRSRMRNTLVVAQTALSLALLATAGLIVRSLQQVQMIGPGFDVEHVVTASFDLNLQGVKDRAVGLSFYKQLLQRVEALPGVRSASYISFLPLNMDLNADGIHVDGQPFTRRADLPSLLLNSVWSRYFETMSIPLLAGRDFTMRDEDEKTRVAIVNESFARRFFPGQSAVGRRLSRGGPDQPFWEIVGVVRDSKYFTIGEDPQPFIYFPMMRNYDGDPSLVVRTTGDPQSLLGSIRDEVHRLDPNLPVFGAKTMRDHMRLSLLPLQAGALVAGSFALLALGLAGLGLYGVNSYTVSQRTREIGVRMALGAQGPNVLWLVLKQGMKSAIVGLALGLGLALALARLMTSVLVGVSATDVTTFLGVSLLLAAVILIAIYIPARRATKVDPLVALRME
jgi:macrolide transport system ATP-binding/permease protein